MPIFLSDDLLGMQFWAMGRLNLLGGQINLLAPASGVARTFQGGRFTYSESQNEESLRKDKKKDVTLRKPEESGTLAHPGL